MGSLTSKASIPVALQRGQFRGERSLDSPGLKLGIAPRRPVTVRDGRSRRRSASGAPSGALRQPRKLLAPQSMTTKMLSTS